MPPIRVLARPSGVVACRPKKPDARFLGQTGFRFVLFFLFFLSTFLDLADIFRFLHFFGRSSVGPFVRTASRTKVGSHYVRSGSQSYLNSWLASLLSLTEPQSCVWNMINFFFLSSSSSFLLPFLAPCGKSKPKNSTIWRLVTMRVCVSVCCWLDIDRMQINWPQTKPNQTTREEDKELMTWLSWRVNASAGLT